MTGIRWISFQPGTGFGDAGLQYLAALDQLGVDVTWRPLARYRHGPAPVAGYEGPLAHLVERDIEYDTVVLHASLGSHRQLLGYVDGRRTVLYTTWETDRLPGGWRQGCEEFDTVLVPTTFNRRAYVAAGCASDIHVVPHCARAVGATEPAHIGRIGDRFVFYTVAPWTARKAVGATVAAFADAFGPQDDVALIVKTSLHDQQAVHRYGSPGRRTTTWAAVAAALGHRQRVPEVHLIAGEIGAAGIDAVHARGNCFVSLTRSEGWGLCISDALLFGHPVVVTGWGGQLDYLGDDYPLLVDYDLVPTNSEVDDGWFHRSATHRWAKARHDDAVDRLRWVAAHREDAEALGRRTGERLRADYSPEKVARQLLAALGAGDDTAS